jgi:hypothetical protein
MMDGSGEAGPTCDVPDGGTPCEACLAMNCCSQEMACQNETPNDAGSTDCLDILGCFNDCVSPPADSGVDAGSPTGCAAACQMGHTTQGQTDFGALLQCGAASCLTQCM